ncbi:hypothetical protein RQP46_008840 [Phenoliferia psychrophenolica]
MAIGARRGVILGVAAAALLLLVTSARSKAWVAPLLEPKQTELELATRIANKVALAQNSTEVVVPPRRPGKLTRPPKPYSLPVLRKSWQGQHFFDGWSFLDGTDPSHGLVNVRIASNETFSRGSLAIFDAAHIPYGFGVLPSYWMLGQNWPYGGEINVIQQINVRKNNQMVLHAGIGCWRDVTSEQTGIGGKQESCDSTKTGSPAGCNVVDDLESFGPNFSKSGGGVWAVEWTDRGLNMWRFARDLVPDDIREWRPEPKTWGIPVAAWASGTCPELKVYEPMKIVLDTKVCGDWAGEQKTWKNSGVDVKEYPTCAHGVKDPTLFKDAYWKINYLALYTL